MREIKEVTCGFNHAAVVADDDQSAGAHDRAELLQGVVIDLDIELVRGNAAAGRSARLNCLDRSYPMYLFQI